MKKSNLQRLIQECLSEVLNELNTDFTPGVTKISKDDPLKQQKIQKAQQDKKSYELYEKNIKEMARIPTLYSLGPKADQIETVSPKLASSPTIQKWLEYIKTNGPASVIDVAKNAFETPKRQQQLNPLVQTLVDLEILQSGGLRAEPKTKAKAKDDTPTFDDEGEEIFKDEPKGNEEDGYDQFVGFASDYKNEPWKYRDEKSDSDIDSDSETFNDSEPTPDDIQSMDVPEPSSDDLDKIDLDDLMTDFDDLSEEENEDLFEEKDRWQLRAGIRK